MSVEHPHLAYQALELIHLEGYPSGCPRVFVCSFVFNYSYFVCLYCLSPTTEYTRVGLNPSYRLVPNSAWRPFFAWIISLALKRWSLQLVCCVFFNV